MLGKLDLIPFLARGFGPEHDRTIANTPVRGIDRLLSYGKIRLAPETEEYLYTEYTPTGVRYRPGSRPKLESIVGKVLGGPPQTDRTSVRRLISWVPAHVRHAVTVEPNPPNRALSEEGIIESGWGWCNEQARVLVALAHVAGIPGRLVGLYSSQKPESHMTAELYVEDKWGWVCATKDCVVDIPDGTWASAVEIWRDPEVRALFAAEWKKCSEHWNAATGQGPYTNDPATLFGGVGIVNYPV